MKKNTKLLIGASAAMVILCGAVIALTALDNSDEEITSEETSVTESSEQSRLIYDKDPSEISNIHIKNSTGEYDIVKYSDSAWFVKDFIGVPHSTSAINSVLESAATVTSQRVAAENAEDMSIYGLESPSAEVTVTFNDSSNTVKELLIGSESPAAGLSYICFNGENTVYAVNTSEVKSFLSDRFDFIAKTVYTAGQAADENDTTDYTKINSITISRKDIDYDIVLEYDVRQDDESAIYGNSASHVMTSPVELDLNPDKAYSTLSGVFGLTASEVAVIAPSDEMLAQFGIADPFADIRFDIEGGDFHLILGNEYVDENGKVLGRYGYADGIDIIYMFNSDTIPWASIMPMDIAMSLITSTYIFDINYMDISTPETSVHFDLNKDSGDFAVNCETNQIDAEKFKTFYQYFLRAPAEELYLEENNDPADITVTINTDLGTDTLEFIKSNDRMSVIRLNGKTSFRCRTSYTTRLIENLEHLLNNEDIVEVW